MFKLKKALAFSAMTCLFYFQIDISFAAIERVGTITEDGSGESAEEILNVDELPLAFQFSKVDNAIVFLPTPEALDEQQEAILNNTVSESQAFNEGVIAVTAHVSPGVLERNNLPLSFCLNVSSSRCELLQIWDSQIARYVDYITIDKIYTDVETSVHVELLIPTQLVNELRPHTKDIPQTYQILASVADATHLDAIGIPFAKVNLVDIPQRNTRMGFKYGVIPNDYRKFSKDFSNDKFGITLNFECGTDVYVRTKDVSAQPTPTAECNSTKDKINAVKATLKELIKQKTGMSDDEIDKLGGPEKVQYADKELDKLRSQLGELEDEKKKTCETKTGFAAGVKGSVETGFDVKLFNSKQKIVYVDSWVNVETGESPYVEVSLKLLDKEAAWLAYEYKKKEGATKRSFEKVKEKREDPLKGLVDLTTFKEQLAQGTKMGASIEGLLKQLKLGTPKLTQVFMISIIPLEVGAEAYGTLDLVGEVGIKARGSMKAANDENAKQLLELAIYVEGAGVKGEVVARAWAAVTALIAKAGVEGKLTLVSNTLGVNAEFDLRNFIETGDPKKYLGLSLVNTLVGPAGVVSLFAEYYTVTWGNWMPSFESVKKEKTLIKWESFKKAYTLFSYGFKESKLDFAEFSKTESGTSDVPYFVQNEAKAIDKSTWEPSDGKRWVCLYESTEARGNSLCLQLTDEEAEAGKPLGLSLGEVKFKSGDTLKKRVNSIRLFGNDNKGIQVTLFSDDKFTGSNMTWVAYGKEQHNVWNDFVPSSITITKAEDRSDKAAGWCIYQDADYYGTSYCGNETRDLAKVNIMMKNQASSFKATGQNLTLMDNDTNTFIRVMLDAREQISFDKLPAQNDALDIITVVGSQDPDYNKEVVQKFEFAGIWGDFAPTATYCPTGKRVTGIDLKVGEYSSDTTSVNGIRLSCQGDTITSTEQKWGIYRGWATCQNGTVATGMHVEYLTSQGTTGDDIALNHAYLICSDGSKANPKNNSEIQEKMPSNGKETLSCPTGTAICGFKSRIEADQGWFGDDSAMNGVITYCCLR